MLAHDRRPPFRSGVEKGGPLSGCVEGRERWAPFGLRASPARPRTRPGFTVVRIRSMRLPRKTPLALVLALATVAGCAKCGASKVAVPTDRFVATNSAAVMIVPRLATFAQQSADLLATAATFPGGKSLLDARAVIGNRLTFDPFDPVSIGGTGLDPERGLALSAVVGKGGEQNPDVVVSLPVGDPEKFEAAVTKIAKERLDATDKKTEAGKPEVFTWRIGGAEGPVLFGYAVVDQTALVSFGPAAVDAIRAAAAIPAGAS